MPERATGLRERTRRAVQHELMITALDLFLSQGYDATTVDQIAKAAGLSRRSFFRYFASKDDVLAQALGSTGDDIGRHLRARPPDERPWPALRRSLDPLVEYVTDNARALAMTRMMLDSPTLHATRQQKQTGWLSAVIEALSARLDDAHPAHARQLRADALTGAALACLTAAQAEWVKHDAARPLAALLDEAMGAVAPLGG